MRGERVYAIPGNHESAEQITDLCRRFGLHDFHGGQIEAGEFQVVGLGYSNSTPFDTPGEYSEDELAELARRLHCGELGSKNEGEHSPTGIPAVADVAGLIDDAIGKMKP